MKHASLTHTNGPDRADLLDPLRALMKWSAAVEYRRWLRLVYRVVGEPMTFTMLIATIAEWGLSSSGRRPHGRFFSQNQWSDDETVGGTTA